MDQSKEIKKIDLSQAYQTEIFGLGEVYEIMSVERIRQKLRKKFPSGTLCLSSNIGHLRGITLEEMTNQLTSEGFLVLEKGYADSPPWHSNPRGKENSRNYSPVITQISKIIFFFLVRLEFLQASAKNSHMIYCLIKK